MKRVTMDDIAKKCGVSKPLVSLALNNRYGVNDETRFKIYITAIEMGYPFSHLKTGLNNTICVFVPKLDLFSSSFWSDILSGIETSLNKNNYFLKLMVWNKEDSHFNLLQTITNNSISGIIIINELPEEVLDTIKNFNIPIVIIDGKYFKDQEFDNIRVNNYLGGRLAAKYLISKGHKLLGYVGDRRYSVSFKDRYYGFKDYIEEAGCKLYPQITQSTYDISTESDSNLTHALRDELRPTALFCANDSIASFTIDEIKKEGLRCPEDVSVMGFDNFVLNNANGSMLTSIDVPRKEMGMMAVDLLFERMKYPKSLKKTVQLSVKVYERGSVKNLNK